MLPLHGICKTSLHVYLVSPFVENGSLKGYLKRHPNTDRARLVRQILSPAVAKAHHISQLRETALAIEYLHKRNVIHGDIKAANVLVSSKVSALLCDFGLAREEGNATSAAQKGAGTLRWQSREVVAGDPKSFSSDVYAFGMTIYEVSKPSRRNSAH